METHFPRSPETPRYTTDATGNVYAEMPPKTWRARVRDWLRTLFA